MRSPQRRKSSLEFFLDVHGLGRFAGALRDCGVTCVADLAYLSPQDLGDLGVEEAELPLFVVHVT